MQAALAHIRTRMYRRPIRGVATLGCESGCAFCAGNDSMYVFLDKVMDELTDLFPSEYIHIVGDECPKARWKEIAKCQAKIRCSRLKSDRHSSAEQKLQSACDETCWRLSCHQGAQGYRLGRILARRSATHRPLCMSWRGVGGRIKAAKGGHDAIMTPAKYLYFDYKDKLRRKVSRAHTMRSLCCSSRVI